METVRAALYDRYGPPEVLYEGRVPAPVPAAGEVLVRVHATSVNGGEVIFRSGRLRLFLRSPFPHRIGVDLAGEVVALGPGAGGFAVGDRVWGVMPELDVARGRTGSAAELAAVPTRSLSRVPPGLGLVEASALPVGITPLTALRDKAHLARGERLLVRGANGGVGSIAVQLGAAMGAHVTALARPSAHDLLTGLGADVVRDPRATATRDLGEFDVVLDTVGTELAAHRRLLAPGGRMVGVMVRSPRAALDIVASLRHGSGRIRFLSGTTTTALLSDLARYVEDGALRPVVEAVHPLAQIAAAHAAVEARGVLGKHVVRVIADPPQTEQTQYADPGGPS